MLDEFVVSMIVVLIFVGTYMLFQSELRLPEPFVFPYSSDRNIYSESRHFDKLNVEFRVKIIGCRNLTITSGLAETNPSELYENMEIETFPVLVKCGDNVSVGVAYYEIPKHS